MPLGTWDGTGTIFHCPDGVKITGTTFVTFQKTLEANADVATKGSIRLAAGGFLGGRDDAWILATIYAHGLDWDEDVRFKLIAIFEE